MAVLIVLSLVAGVAAAILITSRRSDRRLLAYGACAISAVLAVTAWCVRDDHAHPGENVVARGLAYGYMDFDRGARSDSIAQLRTLRTQTQTQTHRLPSVPAMIEQLEKRLAREPDDAKGWTLLAQSYAFIGDGSGMENAILSAVGLGVPEQTLRSQVATVLRARR